MVEEPCPDCPEHVDKLATELRTVSAKCRKEELTGGGVDMAMPASSITIKSDSSSRSMISGKGKEVRGTEETLALLGPQVVMETLLLVGVCALVIGETPGMGTLVGTETTL